MTKKKVKKTLIKNNRQFSLSTFLPFKSKDNTYFGMDNETVQNYRCFQKKLKEKKKAKRKRILNISSFVLNIIILAVVLIVSLSKEGVVKALFPAIDWRYLLVVIALTAGIFIFDSTKTFLFILESTKKARPFLSFKTCALGRYYDAITPSSIGGQPFQMMYMNKNGIDGAISTSIPLMKTVIWQVTNVILCTVVLILGITTNLGGATNIAMQGVAWIALAIQFVSILSIFLLSVSKRVGPKIVIWVLKLLSKMHIIKNYTVTFRNVMRFVANYQKAFRAYAKNLWFLIGQFLLAILDVFLYNLIPYFIYKTFVPEGTLLWSQVFIQSIVCSLSMMFIPTPGASGGAEAFFLVIFGTTFGDSIFWPLLFWRFSVYYSSLLVGFIVLIYDFAIGNKKLEKSKQRIEEDIELKKLEVSFKSRLKEQMLRDKLDIQIVREQEGDKILSHVFLGNDQKTTHSKEIIKNSEIVSEQEIDELYSPAEKVLVEITERENKRKQNKMLKKSAKKKRQKK